MANLIKLSKGVLNLVIPGRHILPTSSLAQQVLSQKTNSDTQMCRNFHSLIQPTDSPQHLCDRNCVCHRFIQKRFAGHNKWSNIRHIKGANDAIKMKLADQFTRKMKLAISDYGSNDPKVNAALAKLMEQAKNADIPKVTIERALKKSNDAETPIHVVEAKGPGSSFLCIKIQTKTLPRVKQLIQKEIKKFGGQIGEPGIARHAFDHKGIVKVELEQGSTVDEDQAMDIAIEVGAEDVSFMTEDEARILEFICDPRDIHTVRRNLDKMEYNVTFADDKFIPNMTVALNEEGIEYVGKLYDKIVAHVEGIIEIFDNIVEE